MLILTMIVFLNVSAACVCLAMCSYKWYTYKHLFTCNYL